MTQDTNTASGAADLLTLIEAYAEARHCKGHSGYNAQTATARRAVKDALAQRFDAADMATAAAQGFRDGVASAASWISVDARLPEPNTPVLLDIGKMFPLRALWAGKHTVSVGIDVDDWGEYDEKTDEYYCPEGWYEWNEHEEVHWAVSETPRAWRELPQPLPAAPAQPVAEPAKSAAYAAQPEPTPDELRAIARQARNSSGSASDDCGPSAYVLHGWRAALASHRQAPATQQAGEISDYQVLAITTAYEQGVGKGRQAYEAGKEISNPYSAGYRCDLAWAYGYDEGKKQATRMAAPQPPTAQADSQPALDRDRIREIFMAHGFTIKEGQTDLKQYVYDAAEALLRAARVPADSVQEDAAQRKSHAD